MERELVCQGRRITSEELLWLVQWIADHRHWSRKRLSRELCQEWDWRNGRGQIKYALHTIFDIMLIGELCSEPL
jgi:hypothetical protein